MLTCIACPPTALCPGGSRMWPKRGYWKSNELNTDRNSILECPPPKTERCVGWDPVKKETMCGVGYEKSTYLCSACEKGYYWPNVMMKSNNQTGQRRTCLQCPNYNRLLRNKIKTTKKNSTTGNSTFSVSPSTSSLATVSVASVSMVSMNKEITTALCVFGVIVLLMTSLVYLLAKRFGADPWTSFSRALAFLFYTMVSLQIVAQIGSQATGYEHVVLLKIYWYLSVFSTFSATDTVLPTECEDVPYLYSNVTLTTGLSLCLLWYIWTLHYYCTFNCHVKKKKKNATIDTVFLTSETMNSSRDCACLKYCSSCLLISAQCKRYLTSLLILLYSIVTRTAFESIHCVLYYDSHSDQWMR